ncbi:carbohydrate ABC transporter permease [Paenibacillus cymbidii]|uniref:carbohydrate ABC transporter permease n=1 Tax=Paenibacillus cymbidii TaxID=1639034 RepID=UPI001F1BFCC9|nr:carbohydrate ABC transporter permease [Paenibacillus cymbidii]
MAVSGDSKLTAIPVWSAAIIHGWFILFSLFCVVPFLFVLSGSFTDETALTVEGYRLIPAEFSLSAYRYVLERPDALIRGYLVSAIVTAAGTAFALFVSTLLGYAITRKDYSYRNATSFYIFFTMLFSGGLVPWYILIVNYLHLGDTLFALILPYTVIPMFVLFLKGFLSGIPHELYESAKIDGAGEWTIFVRVVLPLSKPGLATVGLFYALHYWNDWYLSLMFIDNNKLIPLQAILYRLMNDIDFLTKNAVVAASVGVDFSRLPSETARMATAVLAAGPMLVVFPFFQKYFVKGLIVGSVKE